MGNANGRGAVGIIPYVPLGSRNTIRVQRGSLRQPEHVGADRQRGPVHAHQEISVDGAGSTVCLASTRPNQISEDLAHANTALTSTDS